MFVFNRRHQIPPVVGVPLSWWGGQAPPSCHRAAGLLPPQCRSNQQRQWVATFGRGTNPATPDGLIGGEAFGPGR